jgi:GNAT superfamily N-acetyltransferase
MPVEWRIESLSRDHERALFRCGEDALDDYLARYALQNQEAGLGRTYVAVEDAAPRRVAGYYTLSAAGIDRAHLPASAARRFPGYPLPAARLARLAVAQTDQGRGLGEHLLMDALHRCLQVSREIGVVAVLVDAKHEPARAFYARYEFESLPDQPLTLWLPIAAVSRLFPDEVG